MHALEVLRNGQVLAVAGAANAILLAADITMSIEEPGAMLNVRGMNDLGNDRKSHTTWLDLPSLSNGDKLEVRFIDTGSASIPPDEIESDSEQYKTDRKAEPLIPRVLSSVQPNATLGLQVEDHELVVATLESGREFISCHFLWNRWHPERCRVSLSSFSQAEANARTGSREWFSGVLRLGAELCNRGRRLTSPSRGRLAPRRKPPLTSNVRAQNICQQS